MGGFGRRSIAITLILASIVVQGFGELIIVRHPDVDKGDTAKVTCISENDDAALIWNYDNSTGNVDAITNFTNFQPVESNSRKTNECEIGTLDSGSCFVGWKEFVGWREVNSMIYPMAPVYDYRWEGFKESTIISQANWYKRLMYSNTIVFSARESRTVKVAICQEDTVRQPSCIRIDIGSRNDGGSEIMTCGKKVSAGRPTVTDHCRNIRNEMPNRQNGLEMYEWHTFRIEWGVGKDIVKVFEDFDEAPFLEGKVGTRSSDGYHYTVAGDLGTRIRFPDYGYQMTTFRNANISTKTFQARKNELCFELTFGLCAECKMEIYLFDESRKAIIDVKTILGHERSTTNRLLTWQSQSVQLSVKTPQRYNRLSLKIHTILNDAGKDEGHWAMDRVRSCQPRGTVRTSTLTLRKPKPATNRDRLRIVCQKLFHKGGDAISLSDVDKHEHNTSYLEQMLGDWRASCESSCEGFGKGSMICNSKNCSCDRGFQGAGCTERCPSGFYGYDCDKTCGTCKDKKCNKERGHCEDGCESVEFEPPFCRRDPVVPRIDHLTAEPSDTNVTLQWELSFPNKGMKKTYSIQIKLLGCEEAKRNFDKSLPAASSPVTVSGLHPYARYEATVTPYTTKYGLPKTIPFKTLESDPPTSVVGNLRFDAGGNRIVWEKPVDCTIITGPTEYTKLVINGPNGLKVWEGVSGADRTYYNLESLRLAPVTSYEVSAYVSRDYKGLRYNRTAYRTMSFETPPAAPPRVTNLEVYNADSEKNTISLRWLPPKPATGDLKTYNISIGTSEKTLGVEDGDKIGCPENYFCCDGVIVPTSAEENKTWIRVYAKNRDVDEFGEPASILFTPILYFNVSSKPRNVTPTPKGQGIIELRWAHPSVSYTKLKRFDIEAKVVKSERGEPVGRIFPFQRKVTEEQSNYAETLSLPVSTSFQISVIAVNVNDLSSSAAETNASTQEELAFAEDEEIDVQQNKENGALIDLKVPTVRGATNNTWIKITVKGPVTCLQKNSKAFEAQKWKFAFYRTDGTVPKHLKIGADHVKGVTSNCTLHLGKTYEVVVVVEDRSSMETISKTSHRISLVEAKGGGFNLAWLIIIPVVLAIILLAVFLIQRRSKKRNSTPLQVSYGDVLSRRQENASMEYEEENLMYGTTNCPSSTPPLIPQNRESLSHVYAVPFVPKSGSVSMMCFEEYAKEITSSGLLATQYTTFPRGLTKPCDYGRLPKNMPKNRNTNLIAYDQTRVVLDKNPDEPYSDYINASYIQGYGEPKAYIATQGPKANTVNDFWRMIWQKKVIVICMLTNVMEDGEKVCEEYWPPIGSKLEYGDIVVFNMEHQVFADYTNRTFEVSHEGGKRKLTHLHYTGWPSRGVPMYSQSLVAYLKKLVETLGGRGPVVVHCSGGDGRTGTVILCDMCVRQGIGEGDIDVPRVAKLMCESRANMVGSPQQFLLAHIVIAESIMSISTQVPCTDVLPERIKTLRKHLPSHIQKLNESVWQERALHSFASSDSPVSGMSFNNKLPELIPVGLDVVNHQRYTSLIGNDNNYIGAISVDGVREKNQNLTAQLPSSTGLPDFWRFVAEQNIELIVVLQRPDPGDPMFCDFMPGESILVPVPYIQIVTKTSYSEDEIFTVDKLILTDSSEETPRSQLVTVLTCSGWGCGGDGKPPPAGDLVSLWQASENIPRKGGLSLVLCRNGVTACGLYLAMSFLLERMAVDRECDVISAVRTVRRSRPEFVQSLDQFDYLYDTALNYAQCFQTYANFS